MTIQFYFLIYMLLTKLQIIGAISVTHLTMLPFGRLLSDNVVH